jgi:hypothetical protein
MSGRPSFIYSLAPVTASAAASDTFSGYAAQNVMEACEDTSWKPANVTGDKTLTLDLALILPLGAVAILGQYLNGITLEIRGSSDNFVSSDVQLSAAAVISTAAYNTAYRQFAEVSYRYIRLIMSGFGASSEIYYVAPCRAVSLPWLEDNHDADCFQPTGSHLIGVAGMYLGTSQQCAMRMINLDFGQIPSSQFPAFQLWSEACIRTMRPFFYVPDSTLPECWFGWVDAKYKFSAPSKMGRHKLATIPFTSRLA